MAKAIHERFIVDENGQKVAVVVDVEEYKKLLAALEELECIKEYDEAKASGDETIPFQQAVDETAGRRE